MKIPKIAELKFKGVLFDVYQWQQKLFNDKTATFEMLRRFPSVDLIATVDQKIVVLDQVQPTKPLFPSLPGGRIEYDEDPLAAAKRELLEETGLESNDWELYKVYEGSSKIEFIEHVFIARNCVKKQDQKLDGGEQIQMRLVDFDEFLSQVRNPLFTAPQPFKFEMYEMLLEKSKYNQFKKNVFEPYD